MSLALVYGNLQWNRLWVARIKKKRTVKNATILQVIVAYFCRFESMCFSSIEFKRHKFSAPSSSWRTYKAVALHSSESFFGKKKLRINMFGAPDRVTSGLKLFRVVGCGKWLIPTPKKHQPLRLSSPPKPIHHLTHKLCLPSSSTEGECVYRMCWTMLWIRSGWLLTHENDCIILGSPLSHFAIVTKVMHEVSVHYWYGHDSIW